MIRNLVAFVRSLRDPVPDDLTAIAEATGVLVPTPAQVTERQAMRARLIDELVADWAREIEFSAEDVLAEWEASS